MHDFDRDGSHQVIVGQIQVNFGPQIHHGQVDGYGTFQIVFTQVHFSQIWILIQWQQGTIQFMKTALIRQAQVVQILELMKFDQQDA